MKYKVILPFSYKFNGVRREVKLGDIIPAVEIDPLILKYALDRKKVISLEKKKIKKKVNYKEMVGKKKVKRVFKEKVESERTETMPRTGLIDFNKESLEKMSKSELKRVATQVGIKISENKDILINKILKSGL